jgi:general stress protein YciG
MNNKYYTYAYLRKNRTPYYIGKGERNRAYTKRKGEINPPKDKSRIIFLKKNLFEEEAFKHEIYMIAVFGRKDLGTGILHNKTNGGQGVSGRIVSEEQREKMRQYHKRVNHKEISPKFFDKENRSKAGKKGGTNTRKNNTGIFSPDYDRTPAAIAAGKKGGIVNRDKKLGIFAMTDEEKREASRKGSASVRSQKWKCKITGYVSNPCGLSNYQKSRNIDYKDKTLRERIM